MVNISKHTQRVAIKSFGPNLNEDSISCGYIPGSLLQATANSVNHQRFLLIILLEGNGRFTDQYNRQFEMRPGTVLIRYPGAHPYCLERFSRKPWLEYHIRLPDCVTILLTRTGLLKKDNYCFDVELTPELLSDLELLFKMVSIPAPADTVKAFAKAQNIIAGLIQLKAGGEKTSYPNIIEKARNILDNDLEEAVHIPALAKQLGIGYESFRKKFKDHTGFSPKSYRIGKKIETAKNLLSNPELGIKQIAFMTGYPDHIQFVKQFKKYTGITPTRFRKKF